MTYLLGRFVWIMFFIVVLIPLVLSFFGIGSLEFPKTILDNITSSDSLLYNYWAFASYLVPIGFLTTCFVSILTVRFFCFMYQFAKGFLHSIK